MNLKTLLSLTSPLALLVCITLVACGGNGANGTPQATDYSKANRWMSIPATFASGAFSVEARAQMPNAPST